MGNVEDHADYDYADGVTLHLFNLENGKEAKAKVRNTKGELELAVVLKRTDNIIRVHVEVARNASGNSPSKY